jgi:hypothetical protein
MSYVPPHRRPVFASNGMGLRPQAKTAHETKKEHREQFPALRDKEGQAILPKPSKPVISWSGISFQLEDEIHVQEKQENDGWINLGETYTVNHELTNDMLLRTAEKMLANYRRFYNERGLDVPRWVDDNPYDHYEDFDREIPYADDNVTESESSSDGEAFEYESDHSM